MDRYIKRAARTQIRTHINSFSRRASERAFARTLRWLRAGNASGPLTFRDIPVTRCLHYALRSFLLRRSASGNNVNSVPRRRRRRYVQRRCPRQANPLKSRLEPAARIPSGLSGALITGNLLRVSPGMLTTLFVSTGPDIWNISLTDRARARLRPARESTFNRSIVGGCTKFRHFSTFLPLLPFALDYCALRFQYRALAFFSDAVQSAVYDLMRELISLR